MYLAKSLDYVTEVTMTSDWEHSVQHFQSRILIPMTTHCTNISGLLMKQFNGGVTIAKDNRDILDVFKFELASAENGRRVMSAVRWRSTAKTGLGDCHLRQSDACYRSVEN
jgi:hypothetical protein